MHFVNVEHTENKLYRQPVRVCTRNTHFVVYFFFLPLRLFKKFILPRGQPYHNVFISESSRVSPQGPWATFTPKIWNMIYERPDGNHSRPTLLPQNRITRTVYIRTAVAVSLDCEVLIKFSFLIYVSRPVAISGISVL